MCTPLSIATSTLPGNAHVARARLLVRHALDRLVCQHLGQIVKRNVGRTVASLHGWTVGRSAGASDYHPLTP